MSGARRSRTMGCPVSRDTPTASSSAGSTPYRRTRHLSRGTGTITASGGTRGAIAWARMRPAATTPRYLRWWTMRRATPWCTKAGRTTPAPAKYRSGAGRSSAAHRPHSEPDPTARHPKQIMMASYGTGMTFLLPALSPTKWGKGPPRSGVGGWPKARPNPSRTGAGLRSPLLPTGEVGALVIGQLLEAAPEAGEFDGRHPAVDLFGQGVDLRFEIVDVGDQPLGGQGLICE